MPWMQGVVLQQPCPHSLSGGMSTRLGLPRVKAEQPPPPRQCLPSGVSWDKEE